MEIELKKYKNVSYFDSFISAGKSLNDKDRNINADLKEIHDFFEPIDRLYGDYESRKKFGIHEGLYRRHLNNKLVCISKDEIEIMREKSHDAIIIFHILRLNKQYFVEYKWDKIENVLSNGLKFDSKEYKGIKKNAILKAEYILDPVKIYQVVALDEARINFYCQTFLDKFKKDYDEKYPKEETISDLDDETSVIFDFIKSYAVVMNFIKKYKVLFNWTYTDIINLEGDELRDKYYTNLFEINNENLEIIENAIKKLKQENLSSQISNEIIINLEKEKLKNFEAFSEIKIRLGQMSSGELVLYLHPYESETHNPIRIPPRGQ